MADTVKLTGLQAFAGTTIAAQALYNAEFAADIVLNPYQVFSETLDDDDANAIANYIGSFGGSEASGDSSFNYDAHKDPISMSERQIAVLKLIIGKGATSPHFVKTFTSDPSYTLTKDYNLSDDDVANIMAYIAHVRYVVNERREQDWT